MINKQEAAANLLERALIKCQKAGLGVYSFDGSIFVCPQPEGSNHPDWGHSAVSVCDKLGRAMYVPGGARA
jgi:hypothetical protein